MKKFRGILVTCLLALTAQSLAGVDDPLCSKVRKEVKEGDLIFLELESPLFQRVARVSGGWASHVGLAIWNKKKTEIVVAHSTIPRVVTWNLCDFIHHAKDNHFSVKRLSTEMTATEKSKFLFLVEKLLGTFYHTGFKFSSSRQFCSKFVWQLYKDTLGVDVGKFETMEELLDNVRGTPYEKSDRRFWKLWFLGNIPWKRVTITPHSQYADAKFEEVFYHPPFGNPQLADRITQPQDEVSAPTQEELEIDATELGMGSF